jgi:hypothetical protein
MDTKEVPQNDPNAKAGYTFDPYSDACQMANIGDRTFLFHNFRQIHVGIDAFYAGLKAPSLKQLPECPPLWQDVVHYWDGMCIIGYFAYLAVPGISGIIGTLLSLKFMGV